MNELSPLLDNFIVPFVRQDQGSQVEDENAELLDNNRAKMASNGAGDKGGAIEVG